MTPIGMQPPKTTGNPEIDASLQAQYMGALAESVNEIERKLTGWIDGKDGKEGFPIRVDRLENSFGAMRKLGWLILGIVLVQIAATVASFLTHLPLADTSAGQESKQHVDHR